MKLTYKNGENFRVTNAERKNLPPYVRAGGVIFWKDIGRLSKRFHIVLAKGVRKRINKIYNSRYRHGVLDKDISQLSNLPYHLYTYQTVGAEYLVKAKTAILADDVGCIDGEAEIQIHRAGKSFKIKLKDLYHRFHGGLTSNKRKWRKSITTYIRSLCGDEFRLNKIINVVDKGIKPVFKIELESGKKLRLTEDHEICIGFDKNNNQLYKPLSNLSIGSSVLINGIQASCKLCNKKVPLITYPYAKFQGHLDNRLRNLKIVSKSIHRKEHKTHRNFKNQFLPKKDKIKSIQPDGKTHVYDIVCDDPYRNFLANGIVVHNCGKTFQFCAAAIWTLLNDNIDHILILTRTSVKYQIRDEIYRFFVPRSLPDMEVEVIEGIPKQRKEQWLSGKAITIASYEQLRNDHDFLKQMQKEDEWNPGVWILDEASKIKNHTTKVARKVKSLSRKAKYRWAVTATPIENGLEDLYSIADFVQPGLFVTMKHFRKQYIREVLIRNDSGFVMFKKFEGYKNLKKAKKRLRGYYLRRTVKDIGITLPPLIATLICLPPNKLQKTLYKKIKKEYNVLEAVVKARLLCDSPYLVSEEHPKDSPKIAEIVELLNGELKSKQVVIATQYKRFLKMISEVIKEPHGIISGDVKAKNREIIRRQFQAGDIRIMLMTDAAEYGLNLQAGSVLINADCPWNPARLKQRIGRIYRIDTQHDNLQVINLVIKDTIEERVVRILKEKEEVFQEIFESDGIEKIGDPIKRLGTKGLEELL